MKYLLDKSLLLLHITSSKFFFFLGLIMQLIKIMLMLTQKWFIELFDFIISHNLSNTEQQQKY